jgi:hypothetical protein
VVLTGESAESARENQALSNVDRKMQNDSPILIPSAALALISALPVLSAERSPLAMSPRFTRILSRMQLKARASK